MSMNISQKINITAIFVLCSCSCADTDYSQSADPTAVKALPDSVVAQVQNPPTFSWSQFPGNPGSYIVEIKSQDGKVDSYTSQRNWFLPSRPFKDGAYTWRVTSSEHAPWSKERPFIVSAASTPFVIPDNTALRAAILKRSRPKSLGIDFLPVAKWTAAMKQERQNYVSALIREVDSATTALTKVNDANWPLSTSTELTTGKVAQIGAVRRQIYAYERQIEAASLLYALTGEKRFFDEAVTRGDQLTALNPNGPTSFANQDQATRAIALSLIHAIDVLGTSLDQLRRSAWLKIVSVRTGQIYQDLIQKNNRIDQYPFDSHGGTNLGYLALISTLALGEIPEATTWFDFAFRDYASWIMAWSGPEGGFANGTSYAQYSAWFALKLWQPLNAATGINLFAKPWSRGFLAYLVQFVPPGSPNHVFGDEHELAPDFKIMKAYAARFASPEALWYVRALPDQEDPVTLLSAPYPLPVDTVRTSKAPANAANFPGIGWVAMHSNLADPQRTSLYFKASQYGSFSHSHGDQNSFTLTKAGVPLLIETGWDDWYGSPLSASWYRQTKAHNAITTDGGNGQIITGYEETLAKNGKITDFASTTELDYAAGDATSAYGGMLTSAIRKVWYLRKANVFVIEDRIAASAPHQFEWNLHAAAPISYAPSGTISISNRGQSVCIRPINTDGIRFEKRTGPTPPAGKFEDHAVLLTTSPVPEKKFLILLDVGCNNPAVIVTSAGQKMMLKIAAQTISIAD